MNLNTASQKLGVHYQTAYKWVRSGELIAIRVGGRYEISDAAISSFLAARSSYTSAWLTDELAGHVSRSSAEQFLDVLETISTQTLLSTAAAIAFAAQGAAEVLGDMCAVVLMNDGGTHAVGAAFGHLQPARAVFAASAFDVLGSQPFVAHHRASSPRFYDQTVRLSHVPREALWHRALPELRQYLEQYPVNAVVVAPIEGLELPIGFVAFSRDRPDHRYTADDQALAEAIGERLGLLVITTGEIAEARATRDAFGQAVSIQIGLGGVNGTVTKGDVERLLGDHLSACLLPVIIYGQGGEIVGANDPARMTMGAPGSGNGATALTFTHPDDLDEELERFTRLASGELDYLDSHSRRRQFDGTEVDYVAHRIAVRHPDATFACVASIGRPLQRVSPR